MNAELMQQIDNALRKHLPQADAPGTEALNGAVAYTVLNGGKRMRPLLCLLGSRLAGVEDSQAMPLACAVEYLHSASLIFDDLPSMDDASERRGLPPVHERYGEGVAVLAGLALMNHCYGLFARALHSRELLALAADCIGHKGMIAGQTIDLRADGADREQIRSAHYLKTTALFRLSLTAGAVGCGASAGDTRALAEFGNLLGEAYQMLDDAQDLALDASKDAAHDLEAPRQTADSLRVAAASRVASGVAALRARFPRRPEVAQLQAFGEKLFEVTLNAQEA
jgi:geranylgeranyl diphosphate synthase, type II